MVLTISSLSSNNITNNIFAFRQSNQHVRVPATTENYKENKFPQKQQQRQQVKKQKHKITKRTKKSTENPKKNFRETQSKSWSHKKNVLLININGLTNLLNKFELDKLHTKNQRNSITPKNIYFQLKHQLELFVQKQTNRKNLDTSPNVETLLTFRLFPLCTWKLLANCKKTHELSWTLQFPQNVKPFQTQTIQKNKNSSTFFVLLQFHVFLSPYFSESFTLNNLPQERNLNLYVWVEDIMSNTMILGFRIGEFHSELKWVGKSELLSGTQIQCLWEILLPMVPKSTPLFVFDDARIKFKLSMPILMPKIPKTEISLSDKTSDFIKKNKNLNPKMSLTLYWTQIEQELDDLWKNETKDYVISSNNKEEKKIKINSNQNLSNSSLSLVPSFTTKIKKRKYHHHQQQQQQQHPDKLLGKNDSHKEQYKEFCFCLRWKCLSFKQPHTWYETKFQFNQIPFCRNWDCVCYSKTLNQNPEKYQTLTKFASSLKLSTLLKYFAKINPSGEKWLRSKIMHIFNIISPRDKSKQYSLVFNLQNEMKLNDKIKNLTIGQWYDMLENIFKQETKMSKSLKKDTHQMKRESDIKIDISYLTMSSETREFFIVVPRFSILESAILCFENIFYLNFAFVPIIKSTEVYLNKNQTKNKNKRQLPSTLLSLSRTNNLISQNNINLYWEAMSIISQTQIFVYQNEK